MYTYSEFRGAPNARGGNYYHKTRQGEAKILDRFLGGI